MSKKFYNKCSENCRSQIVFRTDIFRKLSLGAPVVSVLTCTLRAEVSFWHSLSVYEVVAKLVCLRPRVSLGAYTKQLVTRPTGLANAFAITKRHAKKKPLLAG